MATSGPLEVSLVASTSAESPNISTSSTLNGPVGDTLGVQGRWLVCAAYPASLPNPDSTSVAALVVRPELLRPCSAMKISDLLNAA